MLYVQKENCPDDIQAQIDELTGTEEWDIIPEEPSSEQAKIIRERFFDKLKKGPIRETLITGYPPNGSNFTNKDYRAFRDRYDKKVLEIIADMNNQGVFQ